MVLKLCPPDSDGGFQVLTQGSRGSCLWALPHSNEQVPATCWRRWGSGVRIGEH